MGRFILFSTAVAIALCPACRASRSEQAGAAKTIEPAVAAQDEPVQQSVLIEADRVSVAGRVTETDGRRVVVAPATGEPLAVRVDAATRVMMDGRTASAAELTPGNQVRLLYRLDGAQLVAERVDAARVPQAAQPAEEPSDAPPLVAPPEEPPPGAEATRPPPVMPPAWEDPEDRRP